MDMRKFWYRILEVASFLCQFLGTVAYAQPPPADFNFSASAGGLAPWSETETITIDSIGNGTYARYKTGGPGPVIADSTFTLTMENIQQVWQSIQLNSFFTLDDGYADTTFQDGSFAEITVKANGQIHL
jgi:hypothetical protein